MANRKGQWIAAVAMVLLAVFVVVPAAAQTSSETTTRDGPPPAERDEFNDKPLGSKGASDGLGHELLYWLQLLLALALVVGLIFLARFLLRRFGGTAKFTGGSRVVEVLARTALTPKHQVFLVRLGRRLVLVGAGPEGLAALAEVTDPDEVAKLAADVEASKPGAFADIFRRKTQQADESGGDAGQSAGGTDE